MASAQTLEEQVTCPICSGPYKEARKLPGCTHSFCETCILTYVLNLQKDRKLGNLFLCPVCRLPSYAPDNGNVTLEWIQTMTKINTPSTKVEDNESVELDTKSCSQCSYLEKYTNAKYFCVDCKESFCEICSKTFHSFKMTINHVLIDVDGDKANQNVHEQALVMLNTFLTCTDHPRQSVSFYCEFEKQLFCSACAVNNHQNCKKYKIPEMSDKYEENMSKTVVSSCKRLLNHTESVIKMIQEHDKENKSGPDKLLDEFFILKQKVIHQLEILEETLKADSKAFCKEIAIGNLDEIGELKDVASKLTAVIYLIENIANKMPPELSFACILEAGNIFNHMNGARVERGLSRDKKSITLKTEHMLRDLVNIGPNEMDEIASVQMVNKSVALPLYSDKLCIRQCTVRRIKTDTIIGEYCRDLNPVYYGVVFLTDNRMDLSDMFFGRVCLIDEATQFLSSFDIGENEPTPDSKINLNMISATVLANNNIAVSVLDLNGIYFLSADENLEYMGEVRCKNTPIAIHGLRNNDIAVLWKSPWAFGIITLTGGSYRENIYFNKDNDQRKLNSNGFMAVDETRGHVIIPSERDQTIYCYDFEANQIFAFSKVKSAMPRGVAIDGDGNIYVCEQKHKAIIVLSPAGILIRSIKKECPALPYGIGFKEDKKTFAVTQNGQDSSRVHFFSLTK